MAGDRTKEALISFVETLVPSAGRPHYYVRYMPAPFIQPTLKACVWDATLSGFPWDIVVTHVARLSPENILLLSRVKANSQPCSDLMSGSTPHFS